MYAAAAHDRAIALTRAHELAGEDGVRRMRRELHGPLWPPVDLDPVTAATLAAMAAEVRALEAAPSPLLRSGFDFGSLLPACRLATPSIRQ